MIGRYKLLEKIGEGGFGVVFLAAQTEPVKRRVALKVIKPGMDSKEVIARFEAERQALALMDHPNIARVHDAGATDQGRPYFVMELVRGIPITKYCDDLNLKIRARLELFIDVCAAVQHAHQKGIIHRDLKPSNILVSAEHDLPTVKVIDFGIAKAISMELTEKTVFTELGRMIGTPQYMSPEQAYLDAVDVDTRSDIYSLGVVLYELLTGSTPLDPETLRNAGYAEIQTMIRNDLAVRPSSYVSGLGDRLPPVASKRKVEPGKLTKILRGDLDWIVLKALEKDRTRRYQSCNGLGSDVQRYLNDEPVSASPPSITYRCVQFTKRHRTGVTWTAVLAAVLMAALVIISILGLQAIEAEKKAVKAGASEKRAAEEAQKAALKAQMSEVKELVSAADAMRWTKTSERRWKALNKLDEAHNNLIEARSIHSSLNAGGGVPPTEFDEEEKTQLRIMRDTVISCLAIPDMRTDSEWKVAAADGGGKMAAANRALTQYAYAFGNGRIAIHDFPNPSESREAAETHQPRLILEGPDAPVQNLLRFSEDGNILAAGYATSDPKIDQLKLWRLDQKDGRTIDAGLSSNSAFAFFSDGERCAIGRIDGEGSRIEIIDSESGKLIRSYPVEGAPHSISVSRDGNLLAVSLAHEERVVIIQLEDGTIIATLPCDKPGALAWGTADDSLAVCTGEFLAVWRGEDWTPDSKGTPLRLRRTRGVEDAVAWSPDGRLLASQCSRDRTSRLWDPTQGGDALCAHQGTSSSLEFSEDGTKLGIFRASDTFSMFEVASGDVCLRGRGHPMETDFGVGGIYDGVWNREGTLKEGSLLATSGTDGVRFWSRDGLELGKINLPEAHGIAFSATAFFVGSPEGLFKWTMKSDTNAPATITLQAKERIGTFTDCEQASMSPDGDWLAVAAKSNSADTSRALWLIGLNGQIGAPYRLPGSEGATTCAISADGDWLAAGLINPSQVSVWPMPRGPALEMPQAALEPFPFPVQGSARIAFSCRPYDLKRNEPKEDEPVKWLVTGDENEYQFWYTEDWELKKDEMISSHMDRRSGRMAFSYRGFLAIAVEREKLKVFVPNPYYPMKPPAFVDFSTPDFDKEIPLCFSPYGRILVTTKPSGQIYFWHLDKVRTHLKELDLDWDVDPFEPEEFDRVSRVEPPPADDAQVEGIRNSSS